MSDNGEEYDVEKIIKGRMKNGKVSTINSSKKNCFSNNWLIANKRICVLGWIQLEVAWSFIDFQYVGTRGEFVIPDLMHDFIIGKGHQILCKWFSAWNAHSHFKIRFSFQCMILLAAKMTAQGNGIEYLMMWKDGWKNSVISSNTAKENWPFSIITISWRAYSFASARRTNFCRVAVSNKWKPKRNRWTSKNSLWVSIHSN